MSASKILPNKKTIDFPVSLASGSEEMHSTLAMEKKQCVSILKIKQIPLAMLTTQPKSINAKQLDCAKWRNSSTFYLFLFVARGQHVFVHSSILSNRGAINNIINLLICMNVDDARRNSATLNNAFSVSIPSDNN